MDDGQERQLNIHMEPQHLAGVYANFANITFSDYEFTLTFARIDHEVEEGDVPGVVVARVNMSQQFATELLAALQDAHSKYLTVKGIQDLPETDDQFERLARRSAAPSRCAASASGGSRARGSPSAAGFGCSRLVVSKLWKSFVADAGSLRRVQSAPVGLGLVAA